MPCGVSAHGQTYDLGSVAASVSEKIVVLCGVFAHAQTCGLGGQMARSGARHRGALEARLSR